MTALVRTGLAGVMVLVSMAVQAQCPDQAAVSAYLGDFEAKRQSRGFGNELALADAECARGRVIDALRGRGGVVVGYKAAFTNPALQKRFGVSGPSWGAMFSGMMVDSGARLPAQYGARPLYEADFVAVVKDAALADAKTPLEALAHLSQVRPFMELADLMLEGNPSGTALISINVGYRGGALGPGVNVEPTQDFLDALANMTVVMTEDRGNTELGRVRGDVIMGHPINAAIWIARALKKEGITLEPGDLLSLGGYIPPSPVKPGTSISVRYLGLPGDPAVTVHFD